MADYRAKEELLHGDKVYNIYRKGGYWFLMWWDFWEQCDTEESCKRRLRELRQESGWKTW